VERLVRKATAIAVQPSNPMPLEPSQSPSRIPLVSKASAIATAASGRMLVLIGFSSMSVVTPSGPS